MSMPSRPDCNPCFVRQAREAAQRCNADAGLTEAIVAAVEQAVGEMAPATMPPIKASRVHAIVRELSGNPDPYREAKWEATAHALSLYPRLKTMVNDSADPFDTALRLAIAGNIIDLGVSESYDLEASIERVLATPFAIDHSARLREALADADNVLYLGDNAGETVLDRLLIEALPVPVTYVVKGGPAVNDATMEDAIAAGLDGICTVVDNGAATLGNILAQCSADLRHRFEQADVVIAKGMANYESLRGARGKLFFLLQAKCNIVAADLGVEEKAIVVLETG